jgi:hypothetical protein
MPAAISTRNLAALPPPAKLERIGLALSMLDAIAFPEDWDQRYYSFDALWGRGERIFSMRNGEGDFYYVWFTKAGALLHGFAHEAPMSPWSAQRRRERGASRGKAYPGMFTGRPMELESKNTMESFCEDPGEITFCAWWTPALGAWHIGDIAFPKGHKDPDGSAALLFGLDGKPESYVKWIKRYAGLRAPLAAVKKIFDIAPLTRTLTLAINPEADFAVVRREAKLMKYPIKG